MIIKFLSKKTSSAPSAILKYIFRYVLDENKITKNDLNSRGFWNSKEKFIIKHNVRARSINGFIREFNEQEKYRLVKRKDSVKVFHTIISFGQKDTPLIDDNLLKDIGKKYIQERGANALFVGTKHTDRDHVHLHFCSSGTLLNGRSARISNQKFRSIKLSLDRYQRGKYPFLAHSLPDYKKKKQYNKELLVSTLKANRQYNKASLLENLEKIYDQSNSKVEFLDKIKSLGHEPYLRNGKLQGLLFEGKVKYRFSKLGFDQERIEHLDTIKKPIRELHKIRSKAEMKIKRIIQSKRAIVAKTVIDKNELAELEQLSMIRNKNYQLEKESNKDFERERNEFGNNIDVEIADCGIESEPASLSIPELFSPIN